MLKLYHAEPVANSLKTLVALKEKQLPFESVYVDLHRFEQHEPAFLAVNPEGQVPALDHDGFIVTHTSVIAEYLEDAFPDTPPLRPADPHGTARMRYWNKFIDEQVMGFVSLHGWHRMVTAVARAVEPEEFERRLAQIPLCEQREKWRAARDGYNEAELANATRKVAVAVDEAERQLALTPWLAGPAYTLADINLFASCGSALKRLFPTLDIDARAPRLAAWVEQVLARPAVQAALATPGRQRLAGG